jgi:hypothetical protein
VRPFRPWKALLTNMMYWRFRYITRNRLRFRSWLARRRQSSAPSYPGPTSRVTRFRPRGSASFTYSHSPARSWGALIAIVVLLTALSVLANHVVVPSFLVYGLGALIVVGILYWTLQRV